VPAIAFGVTPVDYSSAALRTNASGHDDGTAGELNGAGDGDRTRDIELGKLAFYR
jgi:hypothetical protein